METTLPHHAWTAVGAATAGVDHVLIRAQGGIRIRAVLTVQAWEPETNTASMRHNDLTG